MELILICFSLFLFLHPTFGGEKEKPFRCTHLYEYNAVENKVGDVYSPFYTEKGHYTNGLSCEYRITAPEGYRLKLSFVDLDIEPGPACDADVLIIYAKKKKYIITTLCGSDIPEPIITEPGVNIVQFLFETNSRTVGRGFHIRYEAGLNLEQCPGLAKCANKKCYNEKYQKCNGVDDCGDGTDEEGCNLPLPTVECGKPPIVPETMYTDTDRIVGGKQAIPGSWPWQVAIQFRGYLFSGNCGGALINAQWILTAAHCFLDNYDASNFEIHLGMHHKYRKEPSEQIRYVERIVAWPNFTNERFKEFIDMKHDIALLKLNAPVQFTKYVQPVCLPASNFVLPTGTVCYATGWGDTRGTGSDEVLKQVEQTIMPLENCSHDPEFELCVRSKNFQATCTGDSGGPLACFHKSKWHLMGVISYGRGGLCGTPNERTIFMKTAANIEWIHKIIAKYS